MDDEKSTPRERRLKLASLFTRQVAQKEARKIRGRTRKDDGLWFGLGVLGIVGWSVVIPTLIGTAAGLWIDQTWPSRFSWTLMLLVLGLALGCFNAWYWVKKAREKIIEE
ncbi:MAG: AtpZ/AtpI family protein [Deltaproteobacteria bacterium]|jgi:ATP synthase protein I|nr:AtpZ/AtpI family protein [Deltaproteobacteria bacterium]